MLLTIQYPLADARGFAAGETPRLDSPNWPSPLPGKHFVRFVGVVDKRPRGGLIGWGEDIFCSANRGIHFGDAAFRNGEALRKRGVFRRFYFDGLAVARFELGIAVSGDPSIELDGAETQALIESFLTTALSVNDARGKRTTTRLADADEALRLLYYRATTKKNLVEQHPSPGWSVSSGQPILFVEHLEDEIVELPYPVRAGPQLREKFGISIELRRVIFRKRTIPAWVMTLREGFDRGAARHLRLSLLRLHAEYECLGFVFDNLRPTRIPVDGDTKKLEQYLTEAYSRVKRSESTARKLAGQDRLLADMALGTSDAIVPGERDRILSQIDQTTTSLHARTIAIIQKKEATVTIMNDFRNANIGGLNTGPGTINQGVNNFQPTYLDGVDLAALGAELRTLKEHVATKPDGPEKVAAIAALSEAEAGAAQNDKQKIWTALGKAGKWLLDAARDVAVPIAAHAIGVAIGVLI